MLRQGNKKLTRSWCPKAWDFGLNLCLRHDLMYDTNFSTTTLLILNGTFYFKKSRKAIWTVLHSQWHKKKILFTVLRSFCAFNLKEFAWLSCFPRSYWSPYKVKSRRNNRVIKKPPQTGNYLNYILEYQCLLLHCFYGSSWCPKHDFWVLKLWVFRKAVV